MRIPIKSERDAFRVTFGLALLTGISVAVGAAAGALWGALLFTAVVLAIFALDFVTKDPEPAMKLREASAGGPKAGTDTWRILLIANESLSGDEVRAEIMKRSGLRPELLVLAPVLVSRTHFVTTDVDAEMDDARSRLGETLAWAVQHDIQARGHIGDPIHPMLAIEDEIREFAPAEVVVAMHPAERANWFETGMLEQIKEELDVPVTQVVVDRETGKVEIIS